MYGEPLLEKIDNWGHAFEDYVLALAPSHYPFLILSCHEVCSFLSHAHNRMAFYPVLNLKL